MTLWQVGHIGNRVIARDRVIPRQAGTGLVIGKPRAFNQGLNKFKT